MALIEDETLDLIDRILMANRTSESLTGFREKVTDEPPDWQLRDGIIPYKNRLVVLEESHLRTELIKEAHE